LVQSDKSKYPPYRSKLDSLCFEIYKKIKEYSRNEIETELIRPKVVFLGVNLYQNGIPAFINWDIIYIYRTLQEQHIEARIHDPYIKVEEGLSQGLNMGKRTGENWSHKIDAMILSCPHSVYIDHMDKLSHLLNPNKRGVVIDLYGAFNRTYKLWDNVDIFNLKEESEKAELLGGMNLSLLPKTVNKSNDSDT
jgi:UDP-N-acetyl-D-mannosaminuronate dehydrogenase